MEKWEDVVTVNKHYLEKPYLDNYNESIINLKGHQEALQTFDAIGSLMEYEKNKDKPIEASGNQK